jgi:hypothetical protein
MIPRAEAEQKIRYLATKWAHETNYEPKPGWYPSFGAFCTWLDANKWTGCFAFAPGLAPATTPQHGSKTRSGGTTAVRAVAG